MVRFLTPSNLEKLIRKRFACIGGRFCEGDDTKDRGHALGCPATYRYRALRVVDDYEKASRRKAKL